MFVFYVPYIPKLIGARHGSVPTNTVDKNENFGILKISYSGKNCISRNFLDVNYFTFFTITTLWKSVSMPSIGNTFLSDENQRP